MIRKLREKFVLVLMSVITVFIALLLVCLYLLNAAHYQSFVMTTLRSAIMEGNHVRSGIPLVIVDIFPDRRTYVLLNQIFSDETEILNAIEKAWDIGSITGSIPTWNLRYLCQEIRPGIMRYVFADTYNEKMLLRNQALTSLLIGAAAFLGLLIFSIILSKWIVRPVEDAWTKQRQFVADASHELKTPLTVALSNVDMVLSDFKSTPKEKTRRRLEITRVELLRMKSLVEKLLALARADMNESALPAQPFVPVDFSHVLGCCVSSFEPIFFDSGRHLYSEITANGCFMGDKGKLSELSDILLDNACKYSFPDSVVRVCLRCDKKNRLHLTVESDGESIPPEDVERIFDRFYRIDQSRGERFGYGLGLSIAKEIVSLHHGKIWVESDGGHTVFHVLLPCKDAS